MSIWDDLNVDFGNLVYSILDDATTKKLAMIALLHVGHHLSRRAHTADLLHLTGSVPEHKHLRCCRPRVTLYPALYHTSPNTRSRARERIDVAQRAQLNDVHEPNMQPALSPSQYASGPNKRKRARQACDHCRVKKVRCMYSAMHLVAATSRSLLQW